MKKNILFYFFDGMVDFEISFLIALLHNLGHEVDTIPIAEDLSPVSSAYGIPMIPRMKISDLGSLNEIDALVITGGINRTGTEEILDIIRNLYSREKLIAAICFGPMQLAKAGILENHSYTTTASPEVLASMDVEDPFGDRRGYLERPLVHDGNVITSTAAAFVDFAFEVTESLGLLSGEEQKQELTKLYKNL